MSQQNYKIFVNKHAFLITNNEQLAHSGEMNLYPESALERVIQDLTSGAYTGKKNIVFLAKKPSLLFDQVRKQFKIIKAAGGVVFNESGELLIIRRLGLWDLPKGKLEKGEDQRLAALREVHEECGLNFLGILNKVSNTYHLYFLKGRWILKNTAWYRMIAWGDNSVKPQIEEDITEVKWVDKNFIMDPAFDTYDSLQELFLSIRFPKPAPK